MKTISINGADLAFTLSGQGKLSVVLETGLGAESHEWEAVANGIGEFATSLRYDRVGRADSSPAGGARDVRAMVVDLRALLDGVGLLPPFLVIGHSFGGLIAQVFAQNHRSDTAGLVLVESVHPDQFDTLGPAFPEPKPNDPSELAMMRDFWTSGWRRIASTAEQIDFPKSFTQAPAAGALVGTPLRVLSTGSFAHIPFIPAPARTELQSRWNGLQDQLVDLSEGGLHSRWPGSGHFLQRDNPGAIIATIRDLEASIRG